MKKRNKKIFFLTILIVIFITGMFFGSIFNLDRKTEPEKVLHQVSQFIQFQGQAQAIQIIEQETVDAVNSMFYVNVSKGDYIIEDFTKIMIYSTKLNKILDVRSKEMIPFDLSDRIIELTGTDDFSILLINSLDELKDHFPDLYGVARKGDYLVFVEDKLLLYNYDYNTFLMELVKLTPEQQAQQEQMMMQEEMLFEDFNDEIEI